MRSYPIIFVVAVLSMLAGAQQRGPSTPEERARAVQTAKSLQPDPLAPNVQQDREWAGLAHLFPRRCFNLRLPHPCALCKGGSEETRPGYPTLAFSGSAGSFPVSHGCSPDC